ncbi:MAG TPA: hypothetical protein VK542_01795, partial [Gemmatimonadaceae bacterium]|nr:hypothetical protein [Gemmatimonadaceae bacterium]
TRGTGANESASGILRVTNYAREAVQVFLTTASEDTYLRLIQPGASESFHLPGTSPGEVVHLKGKTTSGREYTPRAEITLGAATCPRNFGAPSATLGCEWILP